MRKSKFVSFVFLFVMLGLFLTGCSGCNKNTGESDPNSIPKFSGLAITEKSPLKDTATLNSSFMSKFLDAAEDASDDESPALPGNDDENETDVEAGDTQGHEALDVPADDMPATPENADIVENLLPEISVNEGANVTPFYADINQDVFVSVSIVNPKSFAILRFTLNGVVYQSYQFESGSTSELLVLKVNSGDTPGIKDFTIDEIKYVSDVDNQIRDAIIEGNQTVKLSVAYDKLPTVSVNNESQDLSSYEATIFVSDPLGLIDFTKQDCKLYFYDGETVLSTKDLEKGANSIKFDGLVMGKNYQYMVVANYDGLDKAGYSTHLLLKKDVNTSMFIKLSNVSTNFDEITFDYKIINRDANLMDIYLFKDGEAIAKVDDELKFSNLLSDTKYEIRLYFNFTLNGEEFIFYDVFRTRTLAYPVPTLNATFKVYESSVEYNVAIDDEYDLINLKSIKLYNQAGDFITNASYESSVIENLSRNANYYLEFIYTYDLNDGNGLQEAKKVVAFSTTKFVPVVEIRPFAVTNNSIQFDLIVTDPNVVGRVSSLRLYQAEGRSFVAQLNDAVNRTFNNLRPNTRYIVEIGYQYDLDDGRGSQLATFELEISTAKQLPTFNADIIAKEDGYEIKSLAVDPDNAGKIKKAIVSLNGEKVKEVDGGDLMTIDGLLSNKEYEVKVVYEYDLLDLNGPQEIVMTKNIRTLEKNKPMIKVVGEDVTYSSFKINLTAFDPSKILTINKLEVKLGTTLVKTFEDLDADLTVDNLYSNNKYEIVIYHEYDLNDGEGNKDYTSSQFISTLKRDDIVYSYASNKMLAGTDFIDFDFNIVDKDNLSRITAIELFDNDGNLVQSLADLSVRKFENLELESFYSISTTYKFDLNDGQGEQEEKAVIKYGTSGSKLYVRDLQVLNNENPSVGEEVQVSVSLDNPNNLKVTGIFISNQYCPVLNNIAQKEDVIIKFVPETQGGYYTVEVTGYEYESGGIKLQDTLTTEFYQDIIVMGELEIIDYFAVSDTNYESYASSPMRILEINNPTGYEVKSITYRADFYEQATNPNSVTTNFEMIDNNHILIKERGVENSSYQNDRDFYDLVLISLTYGIGDVERTLNLPSRHSRLSLYSDIVHIKTVDELIGISSGSNVSAEWGTNGQSYYKYYILDNDLDLKDERWSGIIAGGVFDGNGHTIKNLRTVINDESTDNQYYGLFKEFRGIIFNLSLENVYMSIKTKGTVSVAGISASKGRVYDSTVSGHIDVSAPTGVVTGVSNVLGNLGSWNSIGFAVSTNNYVNDLEIVLTQVEGTNDNKGSINSLKGALVTDQNSYYFRPDGVLFQPTQITYDVSSLSSLAFGNSYISVNGNISYPIYVGDTSNAGALYIADEIVDHEYHIHTNCDIPDIIETGVAITKLDVQRDGYFLSWYDNPEFTGDEIKFPYKSDDKLDIYAKWEKYIVANPNYTYQLASYWDEATQKSIEGYVISKFENGFDRTAANTFVIGGYHNGKPVFGLSYELTRQLRTDSDGIEQWDYGMDKYIVYYIDTVDGQRADIGIPAKEYYYSGKVRNPYASWRERPNITVPKEYEDYYNKYWNFNDRYMDSSYKVKTYTSINNPFDAVCSYAATDEENAYIKATISKANNLVASVKFNAEDLPYSFEHDYENDIKYLNYGDSRFAIINNNVYANVETITKDANFKYIVYKNGDAIIDSVINNRLSIVDLNDSEYNIVKIAANAFKDTNIESIILNEGLIEIGENAFRNTKLTEIKFPSTLTTLGSYAFAFNRQLYSVEMNNNLSRIAEYAFQECNVLSTLKLPTRLKVVERGAFQYCYNLYNITLPKGVETLCENSFWVGTLQIYVPVTVKTMTTPFDMYNNNTTILTPFASKPAGWRLYYDDINNNYQIKVVYGVNEVKENDLYEYTLNNKNEVIITRCKDSNITNVEFEFEEGPVVEISSNAFANCRLITNVVLPDTLKVIGNSAFKNITNPLVVTIPDSVETIDNNAFNKNAILISNLEEAKEGWSNSLDDQYIFNNTNKYVALIINANIGNNASVVYETKLEQTPSMGIQDDTIVQGWYLDKNYTKAVQFPFEATEHITYLYAKVTKNVSLIYTDGIYGYTLATGYAPLVVEEPEIIKDDCYSVFYKDRELTEKVTFPLTITEYTNVYVEWKPIKKEKVGDFTYYVNSKNEKVLIGYKGNASTLDLSEIEGLARIGNDVFRNNETIQSVIIPEGVVAINSGAFYRCINLETVSLPTTLITIGSEAFYDCDKLSKIVLPINVKRVESNAFYNCDNLKTVILNDKLEYVGYGAFSWIPARVIEIPSTVTTVSEESFRTINTGFIIVNSEDKPASWSSNFCGQRYNDGRTPKVIYNDGHKYILLIINENSFEGTIKYEDSIPSIPVINMYNSSAISGWYLDSALSTPVTFPLTATEHITYLYAKTEKNVSVSVYKNNTYNEYLRGAAPLQVYEPEISKEGYYVDSWYKDVGLNVKVEFPFETSENLTLYPKFVKIVEQDDTENSFYYYTVGNDMVITNYYGFATNLDLSGMTNLIGIGPSAFANNKALVSIKLPSTVKSIGAQAFNKCSNLESIDLPAGLKSIGDKAFYNCGKLENIVIPDTVTYIGNSAFYQCYSIKSIVIPNGITRIEEQTFYYCSNLKEVTLPDTVTYIGYSAFIGCGLKSIKLPQNLTYIGSNAFSYCNSLTILEIPASVTTIEWYAVRINNNGVIISNNVDNQPAGWNENYYGQNDSEHPTLIYNNVYKWIVLVADNIYDSRAYKNNVSKTQLESYSLANYKWYTDAEMTQEVTFNENDVFVSNQHITYLYGKPIN